MGILSYPAQKIGTSRHRYQPRQHNVIQKLFRERFACFEAIYEEQYAASYGKYRFTSRVTRSKFGELYRKTFGFSVFPIVMVFHFFISEANKQN